MDQVPLEFKFTLLLDDLHELMDLLETNPEKWEWLVDELDNQKFEYIKKAYDE